MGRETASRDYLDLLQLQISHLDIGTFHQEYSENKRECSESMGGETASRDYMDLSQLQISNLDIDYVAG